MKRNLKPSMCGKSLSDSTQSKKTESGNVNASFLARSSSCYTAQSLQFLFFCITFSGAFFSLHAGLFETPTSITQRYTFDGLGRTYQLKQPVTIEARSVLILRNCVLTDVDSHLLMLADATSKLVLDNTILILKNDYYFSKGIIRIRNISEIRGPYTWHHTSSEKLFIAKDSTLLCSNNLLYYYKPTSQTQHGIQCADASATLMLHSAHIRAGKMGLLLTKGVLNIHERCTAHPDNSDPRFGILLGTGRTIQDNMRLTLGSPRARLRVTQSHFNQRSKVRHSAWTIAMYCAIIGVSAGVGAL